MEMLIVVAIIAVLVAIAIPIISDQLEKSREATDLANARGAYAKVMAALMMEDRSGYDVSWDEATGYYIDIELKQKTPDWKMDPDSNRLEVGGISITDSLHWIGVPNAVCRVSCIEDVINGTEVYINWGGEASASAGGTPSSSGINWAELSSAGQIARSLLPTGVDTRVIYSTDMENLSEDEKSLLNDITAKLGISGDVAFHYGWNPYPLIKISVVEKDLYKSDYTEKNKFSEGTYATRITYNPGTGEIVKVEEEYGRWGRNGDKEGFWANNMGGKYPTTTVYEKQS